MVLYGQHLGIRAAFYHDTPLCRWLRVGCGLADRRWESLDLLGLYCVYGVGGK